MSYALADIIDLVEITLSDTGNLIFNTTEITQAVRMTLSDISLTYGSELTLEDLDAAVATTIEDIDITTLVYGSATYCIGFRVEQRYEQAVPVREDIDDLSKVHSLWVKHYGLRLVDIKLRLMAESENSPFSQWDYEEDNTF
jgi:hypothetical protein